VYIDQGNRPEWENWHTDRRCRHTSAPYPKAAWAPDLLALATGQSAAGRKPCLFCAKDVLLDAVADRAQGPGYTMLSCRDWHFGDHGCAGCDALAGWAELTGHERIITVCRKRFCVLIKGCLDADGRRAVDAGGRFVVAISTSGHDVPDVDEATFALVAQIVEDDEVTLGDAIDAVTALHAAATAT